MTGGENTVNYRLTKQLYNWLLKRQEQQQQQREQHVVQFEHWLMHTYIDMYVNSHLMCCDSIVFVLLKG